MTGSPERVHRGGATVDVVLPVLNEVEAIPWVLARMPPGFRAVVVDNGSTDGSAAVARESGRGGGGGAGAGASAPRVGRA